MTAFELIVDKPVNLEITGKFVAPSAEWVHLSRILQDYELIVMTEGVLYLAGDNQQFVVSKGEYLLLPRSPSNTGTSPLNAVSTGCTFIPQAGFRLPISPRAPMTRKITGFYCPSTEPSGAWRKSS